MHILQHEEKTKAGQIKRCLFGKTFLLTRPEVQAGALERILESNGGHVLSCPTIQIVPTQCPTGFDLTHSIKNPFDWIIFTSKNTVRLFFEHLKTNGLKIQDIGQYKICAVGPQTAELLEVYGARVHLVPLRYTAEGIVEEFDKQRTKGLRFLYPRGDKARNVITEGLNARGNEVFSPVLYRTLPLSGIPSQARNALTQGQVDCIIFSAPSMVESLAQIIGPAQFNPLLKDVFIASIGPITSQACHQHGLTVHIEARNYTLAVLADEIVHFNFIEKKPEPM